MFDDAADEIFVNQALSLLAGTHQDLFTDPVDPTWDSGGFLMNIIQRFICKDILPAADIIQMRPDIPPCFRATQVGECAVDINPLSDCSIALHSRGVSQLCLPNDKLDGIRRGLTTGFLC